MFGTNVMNPTVSQMSRGVSREWGAVPEESVQRSTEDKGFTESQVSKQRDVINLGTAETCGQTDRRQPLHPLTYQPHQNFTSPP